MSDTTAHHAAPPVRASDAERDQAAALLQRHFADGRITQAELEERVAAAYAAQAREQLSALTADLPAGTSAPAQQAPGPDPWLLGLLLCLFPPAGVVYWLISSRRNRV
jgi:hypothetical protein